jgi:hypothetical protein
VEVSTIKGLLAAVAIHAVRASLVRSNQWRRDFEPLDSLGHVDQTAKHALEENRETECEGSGMASEAVEPCSPSFYSRKLFVIRVGLSTLKWLAAALVRNRPIDQKCLEFPVNSLEQAPQIKRHTFMPGRE